MTREEIRLKESSDRTAHWKRWGPYLSERAWASVREDYSANGDVWNYFPHDHARSRAYRWSEDGIGGICDRHQHICFAIALWNGKDPILKERLFGVTGPEGNHGEDVKEQYYFLDSTPTHSYMKFLYKYPQREFPYLQLVEENGRRSKLDPEFDLMDTGIFDDNRYFDVFVEYAKQDPEDICIRISVANRGPDRVTVHLLPHIWFRNRWSWADPTQKALLQRSGDGLIQLDDPYYGRRWLACENNPQLLFTDNETNEQRLFGSRNHNLYVKDAFHRYLIGREEKAVNPASRGTKACAVYPLTLDPGATTVIKLRLNDRVPAIDDEFELTFQERIQEAEEFFWSITPSELSEDGRNVMRQALAGLLWSKQYYHYVVRDWLIGDPLLPPPPPERLNGRNSDWGHLYNADVISMPDTWEYPWYAAWDLCFHTIPIAIMDADFAKEQIVLMLREWYMHPNGQVPAYEWCFNDVNPPVFAWAAWRVYKIEKKRTGVGDLKFLERVFHKLLLNFTWWVNRKDSQGRNIFEGGFLGLDNIGIFDRSKPLPGGGYIEQADGTGWMAMYTLNLLAIAMELAATDNTYEDVASKFWEHFLYIAQAINHIGSDEIGLWDPYDSFFYDLVHLTDGRQVPVKVRSMVGLIPLFAVETLEREVLEKLPGFKRRMDWFLEHRQDLIENVASMRAPGVSGRRLLSVVGKEQLQNILKIVFKEDEFLSPYGLRALSKVYQEHPYKLDMDGASYTINYEPAESETGMFGGNSNWRGPVWFPVNYLFIESLQRFDYYYGPSFRIEFPTGSGNWCTLGHCAAELSRRMTRLFLRGPDGHRPAHGGQDRYATDEHWRDLVLFYEYFHGDTGAGLGASHQTGWTGLVAKMMQQSGE